MQIRQWEDEDLAQFSYAILSDCERKIILVDPLRDPKQYLDYAEQNHASITGILETHPHADFVSGHAELSNITGANIYTGNLARAAYPHIPVFDADTIELGKITLRILHTPGHSADSISILMEHGGRQKALFTGDTLFIGDCGRPDLREEPGKPNSMKVELARQMYHTLRDKYMDLKDDVVVYPAHGAGSLCGKGISKASSSTIGQEKHANWSLQPMSESEFIQALLSDQPFVPAYFPYDVALNLEGAPAFRKSIQAVKSGDPIRNDHDAKRLDAGTIIIDARNERAYKLGHLPNAINLMEGPKFETWLGSVIKPHESFYLAGDNTTQLQHLLERAAAIGYEPQIQETFVIENAPGTSPILDVEVFRQRVEHYTIVDVRNTSEVKDGKVFQTSLPIPLHELRDRLDEIPVDKPIVVHCAGGYRSAAGASIIQVKLNGNIPVFDLGDAVKAFQHA
ncbi:MBL fold metallo-hydrolase [Segetibacter sp. 3557_3]|uniref:MBL fold metallo-hydrolase n=1 Tax=Segetibacter sp. 3557_3 TaxID=2547429 RepID=UPI001058DD1D|nr:MBL fold metallo-hydrolase [Segetibacter sp. 3557_3]TDH28562.1 MBL fold metallo-hydrolase [Segetibacter sp. 3557_3]